MAVAQSVTRHCCPIVTGKSNNPRHITMAYEPQTLSFTVTSTFVIIPRLTADEFIPRSPISPLFVCDGRTRFDLLLHSAAMIASPSEPSLAVIESPSERCLGVIGKVAARDGAGGGQLLCRSQGRPRPARSGVPRHWYEVKRRDVSLIAPGERKTWR